MRSLTGYHVIEQLYESPTSLVYRAQRESEQFPIILKVLKEEYPSPAALVRARQEYEITHSLEVPGVVAVYDQQPYQNTLVMEVEDFGGRSLDRWLQEQSFPVVDVLRLALRLTETLGQVHAANIVHKDINPANIVWNRDTDTLKLIDFGIASRLSRETPLPTNPHRLEGTLAYLSPEQTGRMNRVVDYRTDYYSLGVTLYELLTGQLPFAGTDALALVHAHLAKPPVPPQVIKADIPEVVSALVCKLLAKNAEERYQSARGLQTDLARCLHQVKAQGAVPTFALATGDISERFQIPQTLYGRAAEIEILLSAFGRASQGKSELLLVTGAAGVGKSAVVHEVHKPITETRGAFVSGKFDQYQRAAPYSALTQALTELVKQLLSEPEEQVAAWHTDIREAVGANGQVLIDLIPALALLIGKQPPVPELGPTEHQNRFRYVFQRFLQAVATAEHPLVVFLDDLQWADLASLNLLQVVLTDPDSQHLLLIGAYRDNEVAQTHPLTMLRTDLEHATVGVSTLTLTNLAPADVTQLVADTLQQEPPAVQALSTLVWEKTRGNAFFVRQFLQALSEAELVHFEVEGGSWQWELEYIQAQAITDNVVELLVQKIEQFPLASQAVLQVAACLGNRFGLPLLAVVSEQTQQATLAQLWPAVEAGLVVPLDATYKGVLVDVAQDGEAGFRFAHDRVQQAAAALLADERRPALHLQIGRLLLRHTTADEAADRLFEIVDHWNAAGESVTDEAERLKLATLNLQAGQKAKTATAYHPAADYLRCGLRLLPDNSWQQAYALSLALHTETAEVACLNRAYAEMEQLATIVLHQAQTVLDQVKIYEVQILAYNAQNRMRDAVDTGRVALQLLGVRLPAHPTKVHLAWGLLRTKLALAGKSIESLVELPAMTDARSLAALRIMNNLIPSVYFTTPVLLPLLTFHQVRLSVTQGTAPASAPGYAMFGSVLIGRGAIAVGYRFSQLAVRLSDRPQSREFQGQTLQLANTLGLHWKAPLTQTLPSLLAGFQSCLDTGDLATAALCATVYCEYAYSSGKALPTLEQEMGVYTKVMEQLEQNNLLYLHKGYHQVILNLLSRADNPCRLVGETYDEQHMLPLHAEANDGTAIFLLHLHKATLSYLFGEQQQALEQITLAEKYLDAIPGAYQSVLFHFYAALIRLAVYPDASTQEQRRLLRQVASHQRKLKTWAQHAPMNNLHKWTLVEAERLRVLSKQNRALECYDQAIALAKEHEYLQEEALANELAAKFWLARGRDKVAAVYLREAHYVYRRWGAQAKVAHVEQTYPQLLTASPTPAAGPLPTTLTGTTRLGSQLDLASLLKASQALSGEIQLDALVTRLLDIVMENAGAERAGLLLRQHGQWQFVAIRTMDDPTVPAMAPQPLSAAADTKVPKSIIHYTLRTHEVVVLEHACQVGPFTHDPHIQSCQSKSVLVLPLLNQGELIGVLGLQNFQVVGAFTPERVEMVQTIAAQAAISLRNAFLYEQVRQEVVERQEVESALRASEERYRNLFENASDAIVTTTLDGTVTGVNRGFEVMTGWSRAEVVGHHYRKMSTPAAVARVEDRMRRTLAGERVSPLLEAEFQRKDGSVLPIEGRTRFIRDQEEQPIETQATYRDITERKAAEAALRESEARYRTLIEHAPEAITLLDTATNQFVEVNDQAVRLFGYSRETLLTIPPLHLNPQRQADGRLSREAAEQVLQEAAAGKTPVVEWLYKNAAGEVFPAELRLVCVHGTQQTIIRAIIIDIRARKAAEAALAEAKEAAEAANRAKTTFLASMSHELRTPMNAIMGFTKMLLTRLQATLSERDFDSLETIDRNAKSLLSIINSLLDVSRIEAGKTDLTLSQFEAGAAVREAVTQLGSLLAAKPLTLEQTLPERPITVQGDWAKVKQIVTNLLSNALKYTEAGTITLTVKQAEDAELGSVLEVAVTDTGVGISIEDQPQLFERFTRFRNPLGTTTSGTGLGLPISAEYAHLHGGTITVKSEVGVGSTFTLRLPLVARPPAVEPGARGALAA